MTADVKLKYDPIYSQTTGSQTSEEAFRAFHAVLTATTDESTIVLDPLVANAFGKKEDLYLREVCVERTNIHEVTYEVGQHYS